jgi:excisionase family DNA binding protein
MSNHLCADGRLRGANSEPTALAHSIPAAAARISLSRSRLYELISTGEIPVVKVGSRTLISETDLCTFLDRHRVERGPVDDIGCDQERKASRCRPPPRSYQVDVE